MKIIKGLFIVLGVFFGISVSAWAVGLVVNVAGPNGSDDTAVLQAALDQCVGPNCTVQLAAGTYFTKQLFAKDFRGTFKGRGMDVTIIQALPNLPVSQENTVWNSPPSISNKYPTLILFFGGDITVSDMTIRALESNQLEEWFIEVGQPKTTYMWAVLEFMSPSEEMNAVMTRVALEGTYDESGPEYSAHYNASGLSLDAYPPLYGSPPGYLSGTFRISACRFDTLVEGITGSEWRDVRLTIGGSPSEKNLIQNCPWGVLFLDLDSSVADFSYNDVSMVGPSAFGGFAVGQRFVVPIETPSSFLVHQNRIKVTGNYGDGILIIDQGPLFGEGKKGDFIISDNTIILSPSELPTWAGVEAVYLDGAVISNNRILGSSTLGIALEGASQCMVKANNVEKMKADWAPIGLITLNIGTEEEPILLPTRDSTVVGIGQKTNVYDEGINNTLVGVNNMQGNPPGPAIRDAMKRKAEMIKSMRKP